jgi:hypothetical protein
MLKVGIHLFLGNSDFSGNLLCGPWAGIEHPENGAATYHPLPEAGSVLPWIVYS